MPRCSRRTAFHVIVENLCDFHHMRPVRGDWHNYTLKFCVAVQFRRVGRLVVRSGAVCFRHTLPFLKDRGPYTRALYALSRAAVDSIIFSQLNLIHQDFLTGYHINITASLYDIIYSKFCNIYRELTINICSYISLQYQQGFRILSACAIPTYPQMYNFIWTMIQIQQIWGLQGTYTPDYFYCVPSVQYRYNMYFPSNLFRSQQWAVVRNPTPFALPFKKSGILLRRCRCWFSATEKHRFSHCNLIVSPRRDRGRAAAKPSWRFLFSYS